MNPFKSIDEAKDIEASAKAALDARMRKLQRKVGLCSFRNNRGIYNVRCLHPARENSKSGGPRRCLGVECPVIQED